MNNIEKRKIYRAISVFLSLLLVLISPVSSLTVCAETDAIENTHIEDESSGISEAGVISDVKIEGETLTYNGYKQEAVRITGLKDTDVLTYEWKMGECIESGTGIPCVRDAGTYNVMITIFREGYDVLEQVLEITVEPADIEIQLEKRAISYNETYQPLVTLSGNLLESDIVTWTINSVETGIREIPKAMGVGEYTVGLRINRGTNYKEFYQEIVVEITEG